MGCLFSLAVVFQQMSVSAVMMYLEDTPGRSGLSRTEIQSSCVEEEKNKDTSSWSFYMWLYFPFWHSAICWNSESNTEDAGTFHWFLQYVGQPAVSCGQSTVAWQSSEFSSMVLNVMTLKRRCLKPGWTPVLAVVLSWYWDGKSSLLG